MRYRIPNQKPNLWIIAIVKLLSSSIFYSFVFLGCFLTGSLIVSCLTDYFNASHSTLTPNIDHREKCQVAGK